MIEVKGLSKVYTLNKQQRKEMGNGVTEHLAVDNIQYKAEPGRILGLLGPNGAGKTTTLRCIATILQPTRGSIQVNGFDTHTQAEQVRKSIGFLTGSTGLYQRLNALETMQFFARLYQVPQAVADARIREVFKRLGIDAYAQKRAGELSTGMKQKLNLARTLIHDPQVIILDEPTSGLDIIAAQTFLDIIQEQKEKGKTIIFSSHIMEEVDLLCDDIAIVAKGKLQFSGTMQQFREQSQSPSLVQEFIRLATL